MDNMILYPLIGIGILILVIVITLQIDVGKKVQTKEEKRAEILQNYKQKLHSTLSEIDDNDEKSAQKTKLLKQFSDELSRNIFFDADEIRDVITRLTKI